LGQTGTASSLQYASSIIHPGDLNMRQTRLKQLRPPPCVLKPQASRIPLFMEGRMHLNAGRCLLAAWVAVAAVPALAQAADPPAEAGANLAQQTANPVAGLISVPLQNNLDWGLGRDGDGFRYTLNVQPVVPVSISPDANVISRTILPIIAQRDVIAPGTSQSGLGDTLQSFFFSPKAPTSGGIIWGAGPVLLLPTATDRVLGAGKWAVGPTAVVLKVDGQLTYGVLANHLWSIAGSSSRADISSSFVQPFLTYTTKSATNYGVAFELSHDWIRNTTALPLNVIVSQLLIVGRQPIQIGAGGRIFLASPTGGPDWGLRFNLVLLFPK
jgi:hypothetical protein